MAVCVLVTIWICGDNMCCGHSMAGGGIVGRVIQVVAPHDWYQPYEWGQRHGW